jgi:poly(A) polymerase
VKKKPTAPRPRTASKRIPSSKVSTSTKANNSKWIRIDRPFILPSYVKNAIDILDDAGHVAYVVGGSVRDFLLGKEVKDHDLATSAHPDELVELFPEAVTVGKQFGVLKIPIEYLGAEKSSNKMVEIATFREEGDYTNHRHPGKVKFSGVEEDARRRDFTINALYYDPKTSRVLDPVGGIEDLRDEVVRAIGNPEERFREDALRLLRAVRFTTRFGFALDSATAIAVKSRAKFLPKVSVERIRDELNLMWIGNNAEESLKLLAQLGLLAQVLPELDTIRLSESKLWTHTLKVMNALEENTPLRSIALGWSSLLIDVGRPGSEPDAGKTAMEIAVRMKMSRVEVAQIEVLLSNVQKFREVFRMREATLQRFVREPYFEELLALHRADASATDGNLAFYEFAMDRREQANQISSVANSKLLDGTDLIQLGLKPGPEFSNIIRIVEDLALERKLSTKEEALEFVIRNFVR